MTEWSDVALGVVGAVITLGGAYLKLQSVEDEMRRGKEEQRSRADTVIAKTDKVIEQNVEQGVKLGALTIQVDGRVEQLIQKVQDLSVANEKIALQLGIKQGQEEERTRNEALQGKTTDQEITDRQRGSV